MKIRSLTKEEVDVRVGAVYNGKKKVAKLLCYKKPFVDETILEEAFGFFGFECEPLRNPVEGEPDGCMIKVRDPEKEFSSRQAFGYPNASGAGEKNPVAVAGYHLGIGTELYTSPEICFWENEATFAEDKEENLRCYDKFVVTEFGVAELGGRKTIVKLGVKNLTTGVEKQWVSAEGVKELPYPSKTISEGAVKVPNEMKEEVAPPVSAKETVPFAAPEQPKEEIPKAEAPKEEKAEAPKQEAPKQTTTSGGRKASKSQINFIKDLMDKKGIDEADLMASYKFDKFEDLKSSEASSIITDLKAS